MSDEKKPLELCYICTPYRGADELEIEQNILDARKLAIKTVKETGWFPISPVLNTAFFHHYEGNVLPTGMIEFWLEGTFALLEHCNCLVVSDDMRWTRSTGCLNELKRAIALAREGKMKIRVGSDMIADLNAFEKAVDEKREGSPFNKRTAPASGAVLREIPSKPWAQDESWLDQLAIEIAVKAHAGQIDKCGQPYIFHPIAVAATFRTTLERVVAILHDVVEDTDVTQAMITHTFPALVSDAVDAITHRKGEPHEDYLKRCVANPTAKAVKLADVIHNMGRLPELADETERERLREKYRKSLSFLAGASVVE
jgi:hypothetical protein